MTEFESINFKETKSASPYGEVDQKILILPLQNKAFIDSTRKDVARPRSLAIPKINSPLLVTDIVEYLFVGKNSSGQELMGIPNIDSKEINLNNNPLSTALDDPYDKKLKSNVLTFAPMAALGNADGKNYEGFTHTTMHKAQDFTLFFPEELSVISNDPAFKKLSLPSTALSYGCFRLKTASHEEFKSIVENTITNNEAIASKNKVAPTTTKIIFNQLSLVPQSELELKKDNEDFKIRLDPLPPQDKVYLAKGFNQFSVVPVRPLTVDEIKDNIAKAYPDYQVVLTDKNYPPKSGNTKTIILYNEDLQKALSYQTNLNPTQNDYRLADKANKKTISAKEREELKRFAVIGAVGKVLKPNTFP
jgi:hypothetical protein